MSQIDYAAIVVLGLIVAAIIRGEMIGQSLEDWIIAAIQNLRTLMKATQKRSSGVNSVIAVAFGPATGLFSYYCPLQALDQSESAPTRSVQNTRHLPDRTNVCEGKRECAIWATRPKQITFDGSSAGRDAGGVVI